MDSYRFEEDYLGENRIRDQYSRPEPLTFDLPCHKKEEIISVPKNGTVEKFHESPRYTNYTQDVRKEIFVTWEHLFYVLVIIILVCNLILNIIQSKYSIINGHIK